MKRSIAIPLLLAVVFFATAARAEKIEIVFVLSSEDDGTAAELADAIYSHLTGLDLLFSPLRIADWPTDPDARAARAKALTVERGAHVLWLDAALGKLFFIGKAAGASRGELPAPEGKPGTSPWCEAFAIRIHTAIAELLPESDLPAQGEPPEENPIAEYVDGGTKPVEEKQKPAPKAALPKTAPPKPSPVASPVAEKSNEADRRLRAPSRPVTPRLFAEVGYAPAMTDPGRAWNHGARVALGVELWRHLRLKLGADLWNALSVGPIADTGKTARLRVWPMRLQASARGFVGRFAIGGGVGAIVELRRLDEVDYEPKNSGLSAPKAHGGASVDGTAELRLFSWLGLFLDVGVDLFVTSSRFDVAGETVARIAPVRLRGVLGLSAALALGGGSP